MPLNELFGMILVWSPVILLGIYWAYGEPLYNDRFKKYSNFFVTFAMTFAWFFSLYVTILRDLFSITNPYDSCLDKSIGLLIDSNGKGFALSYKLPFFSPPIPLFIIYGGLIYILFSVLKEFKKFSESPEDPDFMGRIVQTLAWGSFMFIVVYGDLWIFALDETIRYNEAAPGKGDLAFWAKGTLEVSSSGIYFDHTAFSMGELISQIQFFIPFF